MVPAERKHSSGHLRNTTTVGLLGPEPQTQTQTHTHAHRHTRAHTQGLSPSPILIQLAVMRLQWKLCSSEVDWKRIRGERKCRDTFDKQRIFHRRPLPVLSDTSDSVTH